MSQSPACERLPHRRAVVGLTSFDPPYVRARRRGLLFGSAGVAHDRKLRAALIALDERFELAVDQLQAPRNLLAALGPALLPALKLVVGCPFGTAGLVEAVLQS